VERFDVHELIERAAQPVKPVGIGGGDTDAVSTAAPTTSSNKKRQGGASSSCP
jgi:hypothetical protein